MKKSMTRTERRKKEKTRKNIILALSAALAVAAAGTAIYLKLGTNQQEVMIRMQNADGSYGDYQTVYSGNPKWGKEVTYYRPSDSVYKALNVSYKAKGAQIKKYDIDRQTYHIKVRSVHGRFNISSKSAGKTNTKDAVLECLAGETYTISSIVPDSGYHFTGAESENDNDIKLSGKITDNMSLNLNYNKNAIKNAVSFVSNESTSSSIFYAEPGKSYTLNQLIEAPKGYKLKGTYKENGNIQKNLTDEFTQADNPMTFTVDCEKVEYIITYVDAYTNTNPTKYSSPFVLASPTRYGYIFDGWYNEKNERVERIETGDHTLTAHWTKNNDETIQENQMNNAEGNETYIEGNNDSSVNENNQNNSNNQSNSQTDENNAYQEAEKSSENNQSDSSEEQNAV